ncbi:MAG: penicillin acylase family protein [Ignavibacteriales bacterium]|nr:penicillin acylase family protein [Ignavibacteriales bacterium]
MSKITKIFIGLGFSLIVILLAISIFLYHLVTKSFPETSGSIIVQGLKGDVNIYRDEYGVPHISAGDEHDLMFATGYVHAQDRLWQMDMFRRVGQGRLSEILDTATVKFDKLFRTLGIANTAESLYAHLHPTSRRLLDDYAEGVNQFIVTHKGKYPIEFDMLDYEPREWKPQHSLIISRILAWELNFAWWTDLTYGEIASLVPPEKLKELLSADEQYGAPITETKLEQKTMHDFLSLIRSYRDYFQMGSFSAGSNAWVIDSSKSLSGKPILANDPHLLISLPAKWYEIHLTAPGWNVAGVSIPGIPLVVIGQNDSLAWGFTNAMIDDCDFYVEQIDSSKHPSYRFKGNSLPVKMCEEVIYIGKNDSVAINVLSTHHGPIISNIHPSTIHINKDSSVAIKNVSLRWTGFEMSDEILGFYRMNKSTNSVQFKEGLKQLTVPGQCAIYADTRGNIGMWTAGRVPIRGKHSAALPLDGATGEDEWVDYIPFEKLPKIWNPPDGYIVSANQPLAGKSYPYYLSTLWEPWHRYERIKELLKLEKISAQDFQQFQQDVETGYGKMLAGHIIRVFSNDSSNNDYIKQAIIYLRNWNNRATTSDIATTIVNVFFVNFLRNTFEDELGADVLYDFEYSLTPAYRVTEKLLSDGNSQWFDDVKTDTVESRDMIITKSFQNAIDELMLSLGSEMKMWQWGKVHTAMFEHPFGKRKPLDKVFNVGPFPAGGSEQTINKGAFRLNGSYQIFGCPSMRQIVDLAQPNSAYRVLTLGQSGQPLQNHYDDQVSLWLNGGYRQTTIDWNLIEQKGWNKLVLKPN